jgi:hypothetical protein
MSTRHDQAIDNGEINAEKLRRAAALIAEVQGTLDIAKSECPACNRTLYRSWDDGQQHERLRAAHDRCIAVADWMQRKAQLREGGPS